MERSAEIESLGVYSAADEKSPARLRRLSPAPGRRRSRRSFISLVRKSVQSSPELRPEESAVVAAAHSQVTHYPNTSPSA